MKKAYQNKQRQSRKWWEKIEVETSDGNTTVELPMSLREAIGNSQDALSDLTHRVGLVLINAILKEEVKDLVGPLYHPADKVKLTRWGKQTGYVVWAGKKLNLKRPRVRTKDGRSEIPLKSYSAFQDEKALDEKIAQRVLLGLSCRNYERAINEFCDGYGLMPSSISRHFIKTSKQKLEDLMERRLDKINLAVIGIDGIAVAGEVLIIGVGIDTEGKKHILGLWQGSTENAETCKGLLNDMDRRGLKMDKKYLFAIDGSKALSKAIKDIFGTDSLIQRCQIHKRRNVKSYLPESYQKQIDNRLRVAYNMSNYDEAKKLLEKTAEDLKEINPSAARSLEEGMEETLTVHRLGLPEILRGTLSNTNFIESPLGIVRGIIRDVKRWRKGEQRLRWVASALIEAEQRMQRIKGYRVMTTLINSLKTVDRKKEIV
jgi:transposase-like protein